LAEGRSDPAARPPYELLEDAAMTRLVSPVVELDRPGFRTKRNAAEYLTRVLCGLSERAVADNRHLWNWLSLYYFEDVCPAHRGRREILSDTLYVMPAEFRLRYRHLLATSYRILVAAPRHNRLLLDTPLSVYGKVVDIVMSRLYLQRIPCIFEVIDKLYFDHGTGRIKKGFIDPNGPRPGDLRHRLPIRIRQLEKTYDLNVLDADQLISLLGKEFESLVSQRALPGMLI
jgi:hypothetical protein